MKGVKIFMKKKVKNIVFLSGDLNIRGGGPQGYIANLKKGIEEIGCRDIAFICHACTNKELKKKLRLKKLLSCCVPIKKYRHLMRDWLINSDEETSEFGYGESSLRYSEYSDELRGYEFDSITCHGFLDALFVHDYLKSINSNAKLILMSHSPQPTSQEFYQSDIDNNRVNANQHYEKWKELEKIAFKECADYLLFPSIESMEPYQANLDYFEYLLNNKSFLYMPTGCCQLYTELSQLQLREKFDIKTKYIVSYIGRHNRIKGYDILKEIALKILLNRNDVTFVIGGIASKTIRPLNHPRWKELGFVNPAEVLAMSDCFVLPNRQTYFDLVLLEALSIGCPVIASATGGNKTVYKKTNAIDLYDDIDGCVDKIDSYLNLKSEEKEERRKKVLYAYNMNYTIEEFSKRYIELINGV